MPSAAVLTLDGVHKSFGPVQALAGISLSASPGSILALLGPNGAGKSTTIALAVGLLRPDAGTVRAFGADPVAQAAATSPRTGVMLQDGGLPMGSRPMEVLRHLSRLYPRTRDIDEFAERLGITAFAGRTVRRLSGGERQRVALAAALVGEPELVFLDEPTAGMDPQARLAVWEVVEELRARGTAIVLTTHTIDDAERLADDVVIVDHGTVIARGTPGALVGAEIHGEPVRRLRLELAQRPEPVLQEALEALAARHGHELRISGATVTLTGKVSTTAVHELTGAVIQHGSEVTALALEQRTLEDVFLDLTGRSLR
ncbi:ABC transporter ATP-binding protein [Sediminivirga luteola]|uniref:ABC transporter ATP-binding protein n=1 Tax=Sediminivirga luteola TaxID=1774748 RepID=A0A8J2TZZ8_9MICO|nr:ABC transporter ATP-binding protein [Sediminivirga luteola]GGA22508.1 ABC transporter ATP-binding protein [Sediminivirga luteola]